MQLRELNLERNKMNTEKVNLENQLEAEQEYILNKLHKQVSPLHTVNGICLACSMQVKGLQACVAQYCAGWVLSACGCLWAGLSAVNMLTASALLSGGIADWHVVGHCCGTVRQAVLCLFAIWKLCPQITTKIGSTVDALPCRLTGCIQRRRVSRRKSQSCSARLQSWATA